LIEDKMFKKPLLFFLIFLLSISLFVNYQYYKVCQEKEKQFSIFLNDFYSEVDRSILLLDTLIQEEPADDRLNSALIGLTYHLKILDHMLSRTPHYMDGINGGPNDIGVTASIINSGTNYRGHNIPPFRNEGILSQNELAFLKAFEAYMKNIHDRLTEETDKFRSNRDINKYEFNKIISDTVMKDIYYPFFLNEYINCGSEWGNVQLSK
jgi:hypothetical protein